MRYDKNEINHEKNAQLASRARRIKYFRQMHVHAASSERSCENVHLYMCLSSIDFILSGPQIFVKLLAASGPV